MLLYFVEFSFLTRYYYLLYQSLIPNGRLAIAILRQHFQISSVIEQYIVGEGNLRLSSQRLLNFLITNLNATRDHVKFCFYIDILSVLTDLPVKITTGIFVDVNWQYIICMYLCNFHSFEFATFFRHARIS